MPIARIVPATKGSAFHFVLPESAGRIYTVGSSLNLITWTPEITLITGPNGLSFPLQFNTGQKFYRARWKASP